ncbi:MAG: DUF262 domain-containing protein [Dehalococcoidales bacterium]|nr:DUF262 domain-containing protein [Dehalococcoidales bacterium]
MFKVEQLPSKTLSWWNDERENIEMNAEYQRRGKLWSDEDKALLIDSILNEYDIPKLYFADFTFTNTPLNKTNKAYAVIDGKQRLEAIFDFFDSNIRLSNDFVYSRDTTLKLAGLSYKDLQANYPKIARKFDNFPLPMVSVITDDPGKINDLFVRLNKSSKSLTGAEVRNAMKGPVPELIRRISRNEFFNSRIRFSVRRLDDYNAAAKLLLTEFLGGFSDTKKGTLDKMVRQAAEQSQNLNLENAARDVETNLTRMVSIFNPRDPLLTSQGPITVYYWLVRETSERYRPRIREFLVMFKNERVKNRRKSKDRVPNVDDELLRFDFMDRSVNSKESQIGRYQILLSRFASFVGVSPSELQES